MCDRSVPLRTQVRGAEQLVHGWEAQGTLLAGLRAGPQPCTAGVQGVKLRRAWYMAMHACC